MTGATTYQARTHADLATARSLPAARSVCLSDPRQPLGAVASSFPKP